MSEFIESTNHRIMAFGYFVEKVTREQLRQVLLRPDPIAHGEPCEWKHKHIGAGVYKLWIEPK